ncbi:hypothetical protein BDV95DRAFT_660158, partial [Massariosphaeria phaeospora]
MNESFYLIVLLFWTLAKSLRRTRTKPRIIKTSTLTAKSFLITLIAITTILALLLLLFLRSVQL